MAPKNWTGRSVRPRSWRLAGVCAGVSVLALVPTSGLSSAMALPDASGSGVNSAGVNGVNSTKPNDDNSVTGSATWTGTGWIVVDPPAGSEKKPEAPLVRDLTGIDGDYQRWEATQTQIAEADLLRRLANDDYSARSLKLRREYHRWETFLAAEAEKALEHRLELAVQAADELDTATQKFETARQALAQADAAGKAQAEQNLEAAEADLEAAKAVKASADEVLERHQQRTIWEINHLRNSQLEAVAALAADRDNASFEGMGVRPLDEPLDLVIVEYTNLRRGPGAGYEKLGITLVGTQVTATGHGNGFYRLTDGTFIGDQYVAELDAELLATGFTGGSITDGNFSGGGWSGRGASKAPVDPPSRFAFESYVANSDSQEAVDSCTGGLTYSPDISKILGKSYYPIHNFCGGMPILELKNGNKVDIRKIGTFVVVDSRDVSRGDTTGVLKGIKGQILLQTCYPNSTKMRVVGLDPA